MATGGFTKISLIFSILGISICTFGQAPSPPPPATGPAKPPASMQALLDQKKFTEALAESEVALKAGANPGAAIAQLEALEGLGRLSEAAQASLRFVQQYPGEGAIRLHMGECAYRMGNATQAARVWSILYKDPNWADTAYIRTVRALSATGAETEARKVLSEAITSLASPSAELCMLVVAGDTIPADGIKAVRRLAELDPSRKADCQTLEEVYTSLGSGELFEETSPADARADIPLKEKSETVDTSNLQWDASGDSKTMRMGGSTRVVLPVSMKDGKSRWMSVETGAGAVMLSPYAAGEMGLKPRSCRIVPGLGYLGDAPRDWVLLESLTVGPLTFKNVPAFVIDKKDAHFWKETAGILPLTLLRKHAVLFDRRGGHLGIYPAGTAPEVALGEGSVRLKSAWPGKRPFVATKLQSHENSYFLVDTGATPTWVAASFTQALGIHVTTTGDTSQIDNLLSRGIAFPAADRLTAPLPAVPTPGGGGATLPDGKVRATTSSSWGGYSQDAPGLIRIWTNQPLGVAKEVRLVLGSAQIDMPKVHVVDVGQGFGIDCYGILGRSVLDLFIMYFDYSKTLVAVKEYRQAK
jgi:predicted aspartyl protease